MRRIAVVMLTAGIFAGGLGVVGASSASADETGSVRITSTTGDETGSVRITNRDF
ncbi:hypothetical protein AB0C21_09035 [Spirillospora sp. NPDC049024]